MERVRAMDPLVGETLAAVRAVELAISHNWHRVVFESDSKLLCEDISKPELPPSWKIEPMMLALRDKFKAQAAWAIHWVPRRLNQQVHLLAQWAARFSISGLVVPCFGPSFILRCDSNL